MSSPTSMRRPFAWWRALLLALPLLILLAWLAVGGITRSFGPEIAPPVGEEGPP